MSGAPTGLNDHVIDTSASVDRTANTMRRKHSIQFRRIGVRSPAVGVVVEAPAQAQDRVRAVLVDQEGPELLPLVVVGTGRAILVVAHAVWIERHAEQQLTIERREGVDRPTRRHDVGPVVARRVQRGEVDVAAAPGPVVDVALHLVAEVHARLPGDRRRRGVDHAAVGGAGILDRVRGVHRRIARCDVDRSVALRPRFDGGVVRLVGPRAGVDHARLRGVGVRSVADQDVAVTARPRNDTDRSC